MKGRVLNTSRAFALLCGAALLLTPAVSQAAPKTRTWVISWFTQAMYSQEGDCPKGYNPLIADVYRHDLLAVGMPKADVEKVLGAGFEASNPYSVNAIVNRGRIDGKPVNAYTHPDAVRSAPQLVSEGKYALGFNLDGRGASSPNSFAEDPETHEKGINNQYARVTGCLLGYRAVPPIRPLWWELCWRTLRDSMPAWLISVTIDNEETGEATITFDKSIDKIMLDAKAETRTGGTFRIDPNPQWHNVLKGHVKGDMLTIDDGKLYLRGDPYMVAILRMHHTKMRMKFLPNGGLEGVLGGYEPWMDINFMYGSRGYPAESNLGVDMPSMYKALRDYADADPDPITGKNTSISVAYRVEAVPAFILPTTGPANKTASGTPGKTALASPAAGQ